MTSFINKRQQARNERALQDLIRNVSGNDRCADCQARNPGWASWSLGIFLCMRCAALHRKLGTHISKVKSLSMDTWAPDQVEPMKKMGNVSSNRIFNPRNVQPDLPLDPDEIDPAMEKFIRAKYQRRTLSTDDSRAASRHNTGSTSSTDDLPPPVPAKNTPRFGSAMRAASSTYPMARSDRPLPPINEPNGAERPALATMGRHGSDEGKLATLRNMGFNNEKRNLTLLKGLHGNVERTVEALVRLGEGNDATKTAVATGSNISHPARIDSLPTSANGPYSAVRSIPDQGHTQDRQRTLGVGADVLHQRASATSYNPFDVPTHHESSAQSTYPLDVSFQSMNISQQPLFPNNTGTWQLQNQNNPFLKTFTPPLSPSPYQYNPSSAQVDYPSNYVPQRGYTDPSISTNPFLRSSRSQTFTPSNLSNQVQQSSHVSSTMSNLQATPPVPSVPPWAQAQRSLSQPLISQILQPPALGQISDIYSTSQHAPQFPSPYQQQSFQTSPFSKPQLQHHTFSESPVPSPGLQSSLYTEQQTASEFPFHQSQYQHYSSYGQPQQQQPQFDPQIYQSPNSQQPQAQQQYVTPRFDKSSIMALYNQPNTFAPVNSPSTGQAVQSPSETVYLPPQPVTPSSNTAATRNPFANLTVNNNVPGGLGDIREESKDFASLMTGNNGRHSPDAFAGLSARYP